MRLRALSTTEPGDGHVLRMIARATIHVDINDLVSRRRRLNPTCIVEARDVVGKMAG